ncbi:helix-turn-helix domain-containing protein [Spirosoma harenae]
MASEFIITTPSQLKLLLEEAVRSGLANYQPSLVQQQSDCWFSVEELSEYLPSKPAITTIYGKVRRREIPHKKMGNRLAFLKSEIDQWLKEQHRKTNSEIASKADQYLATTQKRNK